jgi:aminopeptidase N
MKSVRRAVCALLATSAFAALATGAAAQSATTSADPAAPKGKLPDAAQPKAYRLDFTIVPDQPRFSGHTEIDVALKAGGKTLYMHGRNLHVTRAVARVAGREVPATWTQVDPTGVVRLDFASALPAGPVTLAFDYDAPFGDSPAGLYHIKVGQGWYSWTQFESIDARAAYPSFDEPGYKTPFTINVTTKPGLVAVSNAPETGVSKAGAMEVHHFAPTKPLPTYLVAVDTGPFLHPTAAVPPDAERKTPLPLGAVATQAQAGKLDYVLAETPRIVQLLEGYFGQPFPFPKLDQIASPEMPGAMENAGADTYADEIIVLDKGATTTQRQTFGMVVSHELSHQWFGDLVSPAWWDDIWLNESFANWMGYRIGNEWRPELNIGVGAIAEALAAMDTDALEVGRPIHQHIATNAEIDSAFDSITYGKGGQVIAMVAAYLGDEKFRAGVRLHLSRHMYGNATTDQFFQSLADAAKDPRVLASMRSFVDQPGVPLVTFSHQGGKLIATQSRYAFYGSKPKPLSWTIPLCMSGGAGGRDCVLLDRASMSVTAPAGGYLMPNTGGTGYYRFELPAQDWKRLIAALPTLPNGEALAADDSLWASFRAGRAQAESLIAEASSILGNKDSGASLAPGRHLAGLRIRGFIEGPAVEDYRRLMQRLYAPKLAAIGFNPEAGAHASDPPDLQKQRQQLVDLVAIEGRDSAVRAKLIDAAKRDLAGDAHALDQAFRADALEAYAEEGGLPAAKELMEKGLSSEDALFRDAALGAAASSDRPEVAEWLLSLQDKRLRPTERLEIIRQLAAVPGTRDMAGDWLIANWDNLIGGANGIFFVQGLPGALRAQCSAEKAAKIEAVLGPKIRARGAGLLTFQRTVEQIRHCGDLKTLKEAELAAALKTGA